MYIYIIKRPAKRTPAPYSASVPCVSKTTLTRVVSSVPARFLSFLSQRIAPYFIWYSKRQKTIPMKIGKAALERGQKFKRKRFRLPPPPPFQSTTCVTFDRNITNSCQFTLPVCICIALLSTWLQQVTLSSVSGSILSPLGFISERLSTSRKVKCAVFHT